MGIDRPNRFPLPWDNDDQFLSTDTPQFLDGCVDIQNMLQRMSANDCVELTVAEGEIHDVVLMKSNTAQCCPFVMFAKIYSRQSVEVTSLANSLKQVACAASDIAE